MHFKIINTETIYRRLLAEPDAAAREAIFHDELVAPFQGMVNSFGGGDGLAMYGMWGMSPEQFAGEKRAWMEQTINGLAAANA